MKKPESPDGVLAYLASVLGAQHVTTYGRPHDPFLKVRDKARRLPDGRLDLQDGPEGPRSVAVVERDIICRAPLEYITIGLTIESGVDAFRRKAHRQLRKPVCEPPTG